jgi:hypothetical protein
MTASTTVAPGRSLQPFDTLLSAQHIILGSPGATNQTFQQVESLALTQLREDLFNIGCGECVLSHSLSPLKTIDLSGLIDVLVEVSIKLDGLSRGRF